MTDYPNLFSPMRIGPKTAKNRVWMTAHSTQLVKDHNFSDEHVHYYAERARGGVGVITMEAMAVHPTTQPYKGKIFAFQEAVVKNYRKLAEAVHEHGCLLLAQPWHRGRETNGTTNRLPVWAPSSVPCTVYREMPHVLTEPEIGELVEGYRLAAKYAYEGGLDGVEVHGLAHGYLLGQFLSPATNHRTDAYGGSFEKRLKIVLDIIDKTREEVGPDRIVGVRINGTDGGVPGGLTNADWTEIAQALVATGKIDYVSVTAGTYIERMNIYGATPQPAGFQLQDTANIKRALPDHIPVVAVGRLNTPELAEAVLTRGDADMIGMTRTLIADPEWPNKAQRGDATQIRPCVGANWCLASIVNSPLACIHNPAVARETVLGIGTLKQAPQSKRVAVVGGGPGGLRAALTASQRGHSVTLFEQNSELGGQVALMAQSASYAEWQGITDWLISQIGLTQVEVKLGHRAEADDLSGFDEVIIATGSTPLKHGWSSLRPASWGDGTIVPGVDQWNVYSINEVLAGKAEVGPNVFVFDDTGARQPVVVAEHLADRRHNVTIVTRLPQVSPDLEASRDLQATYRRIRGKGVRFITDHELVSVVEDSVTLADVWTGESTVHSDVDAVVLSTGNKAEDALFHALQGVVPVRAIGDSVSPRRVFNAIWEGELAGREV
ncbi:2,4-dienoyl-CoA reductase [Lentzea fradiae]|uniref:2,4-dienoyl-CoA reductase n=1 Tax=Lentzea fradiae TaxID=200378 RepID=A0A1G7KCY7_9PSEU|nr:FAD-dependent oxidoreductase [Lentzea fradiae]SDF35047.1 2,4-dienoyl-CoA reductase [Lentzea fradiae]